MGAPRRVDVTMLGQTLTLKSEESPEYLQSLARYIESRVTALRKSGVADPMRALLLAALDITDELFHLRKDGEQSEGDLRRRVDAMLALLERATPR